MFLHALPMRPVLLGTVYDPTFGDDSRNFLGVDARIARANFNRVNAIIAELAVRYGQLIDLYRHFLGGDPSWFTYTIEPSLRGASEIRCRIPASGIEGPKMPDVGAWLDSWIVDLLFAPASRSMSREPLDPLSAR